LELLKSDFLGLIGNCLKGGAPKDFGYAARHTVREFQQALDEALVDFHRSFFERQQSKVSGNEPT
jgi:hypothetical protein